LLIEYNWSQTSNIIPCRKDSTATAKEEIAANVGKRMRESRQGEGGDQAAQPASKVVRLPRDWLGPREKLVPFGRPATTREADLVPAQSTSASALIPEPPPSAADFWGERSAAIHDVVQAPEADATATRPTRRVAAPARRRAAAAAGLAIAAATALALVSVGPGSGGSPNDPAGGARLDVAAVFSSGLPAVLQRGLTLLDGRAVQSATKVGASRRVRSYRRTARPHSVFKRVHDAAHRQPRATAPAPASTRKTYHPRVMPTSAGSSATGESATPQPSRASSSGRRRPLRSSGAGVSATGQSGALGPIQSPNG
jgi:hypothetical protein